jgi:hypothetical protein
MKSAIFAKYQLAYVMPNENGRLKSRNGLNGMHVFSYNVSEIQYFSMSIYVSGS